MHGNDDQGVDTGWRKEKRGKKNPNPKLAELTTAGQLKQNSRSRREKKKHNKTK